MKPFSRVRLRLAAWNLVVLAAVLVVTIGSAVWSEVRASDLAVDHDLRDGAARASARLLRERHGDANDGDGRRVGKDDGDGHHGDGDGHHGDGDGHHGDGDGHHDDRDEGDGDGRRGGDGDGDGDGEGASDLLVFSMNQGEGAVRSNRSGRVADLPDHDALRAALRGNESQQERTAGGVPVRLLTVPVAHDGKVIAAVQIVKALRETQGALSRTILTLVLTGAAGLLLSAAGSWFLAGRAMRPIEASMDRQRRFIADASHELRTPVAVLRARAELLQRDAEALPEGARDEIEKLERDAGELSTLLGELLDLARLDAGDDEVSLEPVAVADVAEEVVEQLGPLAEARGVVITSKVQPVWAHAHLSRVRQVLRALGDNAIKHTPSGGHVVIQALREGDRATLTVSDDGEGIAAEHLPRVFDRFYRADAARSGGADGARRGAGLGLAIAAELVRSMRGTIAIDSAPKQGTTVKVTLQVASPS